jgi:hypothetical protein
MTAENRPRKLAAVAHPNMRKFLRTADPVIAQVISARPVYPFASEYAG